MEPVKVELTRYQKLVVDALAEEGYPDLAVKAQKDYEAGKEFVPVKRLPQYIQGKIRRANMFVALRGTA